MTATTMTTTTTMGPPRLITCKRHNTCKNLARLGAVLSAFLIPVNHYYGQRWVAMLGKECCGPLANAYNLIGGKGEVSDRGCIFNNLKREIFEEMKLRLTNASIERYIRSKATGQLRVMLVGRTPIFIGYMPNLSRKPLIAQIKKDNANSNLPDHFKEMTDLQWIDLSDLTSKVDMIAGRVVKSGKVRTTQFAKVAMKRIHPNSKRFL